MPVCHEIMMKALHTWYKDRVGTVVVKEGVFSGALKADCSEDTDRESDLDCTVDQHLHRFDASWLQSDVTVGLALKNKTKGSLLFLILAYLLPFVFCDKG